MIDLNKRSDKALGEDKARKVLVTQWDGGEAEALSEVTPLHQKFLRLKKIVEEYNWGDSSSFETIFEWEKERISIHDYEFTYNKITGEITAKRYDSLPPFPEDNPEQVEHLLDEVIAMCENLKD